VLDSDAVVHELYATDEVRAAVVERYGSELLGPDGAVDRRALARRIFADPAERQFVEALIHPLVAKRAEEWRAREAGRVPAPRALVQEVALLFEAGAADRYDRTLLVTAPAAARARRLAARGGLEAAAAREARLLPEAEKRRLADDVLANDGDLEALDRAVAAYLDALDG
jgi:dephospho-CoA kinase